MVNLNIRRGFHLGYIGKSSSACARAMGDQVFIKKNEDHALQDIDMLWVIEMFAGEDNMHLRTGLSPMLR